MSIPVNSSDIVLCCGDSIPNPAGPIGGWANVPGGLADRLSRSAVSYSSGGPVPPARAGISVVSSGVSSQAIAAFLAGFSTQVTPFAPTIVIPNIAVNDAILGTDIGVFTADYNAWAVLCLALNPNMKFLFGSALANGELHNGSGFTGNATDSAIAAVNTAIQGIVTGLQAAGHQAAYLNWRDALFALELVRNTDNQANGRLTIDGVHPIKYDTCQMMADVVLAQLSVG